MPEESFTVSPGSSSTLSGYSSE